MLSNDDMKTITIPTETEICRLTDLLMSVDNGSASLEYVLERIRRCINEYMAFDAIITVVGDLMRGATNDENLYNQIMLNWVGLLTTIYHYILQADLQLPVDRIVLNGNDLSLIADG